MSDRIRCLTADGIAAFERYLSDLQRNARVPPPYQILEHPDHSKAFDQDIEIDRGTGALRIAKACSVLECGQALVPETRGRPLELIEANLAAGRAVRDLGMPLANPSSGG